MIELDILLPFGLPPAELSADLLRELHAPALATLLARAKLAQQEQRDGFQLALPHETWLAQQFGFAGNDGSSPPVAEALMQKAGLQTDNAGAWFILQPVHIHIARDHLVLTDPRQLGLDENEARALFKVAEPLLAEAGKALRFGEPGIWFVQAGDWAGLRTATPDAACGHNIDIWMPAGPQERNWRKVQNEVQMHWFNHPVNEQREARGEKPVNSVWLWGGPSGTGTRPGARYDKIFNLSGWMQAFCAAAPRHGEAGDGAQLLPQMAGRNLLLLDALLEPALSSDWAGWLDGMRKLEERWFAPLLQSLQSAKLDTISLILTHDARISRFAASRPSLRKFWVKPSLARLCP
ncbi:MAG TPA: hypothetical protein VEC01_17270 [Noviherbaspirillum sp.]|uniref:hypothetical protein n=1 Tax=Noviherbaspirillum sp. TaxID=1926288 RepID=UPI002D2C937F|nr:hypothetical protein [Noviherbaspirillum sp.]HYD97083.1 hypothetical protein [Noviherbaspirillum sp.]